MLTGASGPLRGCKVVELAGIGPGPFCGLVLSGAFLHDTVFLWPLLGTDTGDVGLFPPLTLLVLGEAAGVAVCAWSVGRFGLGQPARRAGFVRDGRLTELTARRPR